MILGGLGQYIAVLVGTGSEQGVSGCQCDMLPENICFTWCKPSNYSIFREGRSDDGQTDRQTHRISYLRLDPFCGRGRVKNQS